MLNYWRVTNQGQHQGQMVKSHDADANRPGSLCGLTRSAARAWQDICGNMWKIIAKIALKKYNIFTVKKWSRMNIWQEDFTLESQLPHNKASLCRLKLQSTTMATKCWPFSTQSTFIKIAMGRELTWNRAVCNHYRTNRPWFRQFSIIRIYLIARWWQTQ